jgi:hypothetical protein
MQFTLVREDGKDGKPLTKFDGIPICAALLKLRHPSFALLLEQIHLENLRVYLTRINGGW